MQTSQVTNPANVLSSPAPANKQSESNSTAAPFGQVLSREIADRRSANEGAKTQPRESGNAQATRQPARNDTKANEAKSAKDTQGKAKTDNADEDTATVDAAAQASEDMLALVANLNQVVAPETAATETAPVVTEEAPVATDPGLLLAAAGNVPVVTPQATQPGTDTAPVDIVQAGAQRKTDAALAGLMPATRTEASAQTDTVITEKTDQPQAAIPDLVAKGQELLNGTSVGVSAKGQAQDFAAAIKDSVAAVATPAMAPVQQAVLNAAQSMGNAAADRLTPRVGTPAWDQALGQKVVWMVAGEQQSASLTLNPPDLGPLQVVLNVSNSQANATFIAAQPEVRQALEAAMPKLRDMLGEAGIQLGQASVNSGSPNQQGGFDQQASSSARGLGHADNRSDAANAEAPAVGRVQPASVRQGLVNTFA